jgi:signal transduction histidine kinase/ActR/RegA family two-component response regulator
MTSGSTPPLDPVLARILRSGGEMGALVREFDWAGTPLGPVNTWPASLRIAVSILLATRHPMFLWWGPDLIQFYNDGYRQSLGPDRHPSALGQRGRECWAEIWPIIGAEVEDIMAGGEATWHEDHLVPITRGDRVEDVFWSYSYSPVQDDHGGVGGVLVTVQETTHRVLAERRKQLVRELTERLVAEDSIAGVASAAAATMLGHQDIGFTLLYLVDEDNRDSLRLAAHAGVSAGDPAMPRQLSRSSEPQWPVAGGESVAIPIYQENGRHLEGMLVAGVNPRVPMDEGYQSFFADVEQAISRGFAKVRARELERKTELQLSTTERLQSVGALAGGVAHEVNNQMTVVLGFGEFVLKALGPNHPQSADMHNILTAGNRAARVSQQLLAFSRQQLTQPRILRLNDVIGSMDAVLRQVLGSDKTLTIEPDSGASAINADPIQIEQVLINLVANARDATATGGQVIISVANEELSERSSSRYGVAVVPGPYVLLRVSDTGHGMEESTLTRIFEPFFTTKKVGEGTGLGLSMVYGIVKRHEGYVWADSAPGQGTTLRLYWPAMVHEIPAALPAEKPGSLDQLQADAGPRTVWVVEDEEQVRALVARALAEKGLHVVSAEDGAAAIRLLEQTETTPALVITDLVMPRVIGRQLSEAVRARNPDVPILFMSGYASDDVVRRGLMPENADFLQKPFTPAELLQAIATVLDRSDVSVQEAQTAGAPAVS